MKFWKIRWLGIILLLIVLSCKKDDDSSDNQNSETGKIRFEFYHYVDGKPLIIDSLIYTNAAGNQYMVNEIQYFISDVTLYSTDCDCSDYVIHEWKDIHYIDTDIPETHSWDVFDKIKTGNYYKITFTFGINEQKNQSLIFVNPPESFMFWPEYLGGGYHYMKLNGKWKDSLQNILPFNFHLGIGQVYDSTGNITGFIQNYFTVSLPQSSFAILAGQTTTIGIVMNIENWFKEPNVFDHNVWGGDIMQKQAAMQLGCENGNNVFSIKN
ncbi:MbnP family protein [Bacteroidota bacterium]